MHERFALNVVALFNGKAISWPGYHVHVPENATELFHDLPDSVNAAACWRIYLREIEFIPGSEWATAILTLTDCNARPVIRDRPIAIPMFDNVEYPAVIHNYPAVDYGKRFPYSVDEYWNGVFGIAIRKAPERLPEAKMEGVE